MISTTPAEREFLLRGWLREVSNFSIYRQRGFAGALVTMRHSGTQWLKYMLSLAIAQHYDLPPPQYVNNASSNEFLGHPKAPRQYSQTPAIAMSHSIPHSLFDWPPLRRSLGFPPYALLLRDLRAALVAGYEKTKLRHGLSFSDYILGDPGGRARRADAWHYVRFLNRWGRIASRFPQETLIIRYEDMRASTLGELKRINLHLSLKLSDAELEGAIAEATKDKMASRIDPGAPEVVQRAVRRDERDPLDWYSSEDSERLRVMLARHLRYDFGYDYGLDPSSENSAAEVS